MKRLCDVKDGDRFIYGGIEWVKLTHPGTIGAVAIAAEPVFERAFDENGFNYWSGATLRRELNGNFLEAMLAEGAKLEEFESCISSLTANDGTRAYGTAEDKIALVDNNFYRGFHSIIPDCEKPWWTLTPQTSNDCLGKDQVCYIDECGVIMACSAESKEIGVRPVCCINVQTLVIESEEERVRTRAEAVETATEDVMNTLCSYGAAIWGEVLVEVIKAIFAIKTDAEAIAQEAEETRKIKLSPDSTCDLYASAENAQTAG